MHIFNDKEPSDNFVELLRFVAASEMLKPTHENINYAEFIECDKNGKRATIGQYVKKEANTMGKYASDIIISALLAALNVKIRIVDLNTKCITLSGPDGVPNDRILPIYLLLLGEHYSILYNKEQCE